MGPGERRPHPPCANGGCGHSYGRHNNGPNYGCTKCPRRICPRYRAPEPQPKPTEVTSNGDTTHV
jgi:hypothetical protein